MRKSLLIAALISAAFWIGGSHGLAQQQSPAADGNAQQTVPDAPQPQEKPAKPAAAPKPSSPPSGAGKPSTAPSGQSSNQPSSPAKPSAQPPAAKPHSANSDNAFPEDISRKAAQAAANAQAPANSSGSQPSGTKPASSAAHSSGEANPFPEDVSRKAAQAAEKGAAGTDGNHPKAPVPPGESSSQASSLTGGLLDNSAHLSGAANPIRAKKDTEVGDFYMAQQDYKGAYLRYQDAMQSDPGNINAIFGAAEAARHLGKISEAARNYQMYLEIEPNGSKAKRALKALNALPAKN